MRLEATRQQTEVGPSNCNGAATNPIALGNRRVFRAIAALLVGKEGKGGKKQGIFEQNRKKNTGKGS